MMWFVCRSRSDGTRTSRSTLTEFGRKASDFSLQVQTSTMIASVTAVSLEGESPRAKGGTCGVPKEVAHRWGVGVVVIARRRP